MSAPSAGGAHVATPATPRGVAAVELRGITRQFPGVLANDHVDLEVWSGEVHCLLGENGAGKSTLMNVLAGVCLPDEGTILVDGREAAIARPRDALDLGIGMVYQHSSLIPTFTVLENLLLGRDTGVRLDLRGARLGFAELAAQLGVDVDPGAQAGRLSLGQRQQVEIVRALWHGSRVLILDEPTSMLTPQGVDDLERVLVRLTERGLAVVFITHKLEEAFAIGDRISVLRRGRLAGTIDAATMKALSASELERTVVELMFPGEAQSLALEHHAFRRPGAEPRAAGAAPTGAPAPETAREPLLELSDVTVAGERDEVGIREPLTLTVHAGEVVGVAGVDGNGQRPLAEAIAGQRPLAGGDVRLCGTSLRRLSIAARQRLGLRYVTDDRLGEGVVGRLSVALNLVSKRIGRPPFWVRGRARLAAIDAHAAALVEAYGITPPDVHALAGTLSGGNVQKVVVARELSIEPRLVVFSKPTYGLDLKTAAAVHARIRALADSGVAGALLISTDLEELLALSDRVAVLSRGRLMGVVSAGPGAEQRIGALMIGGGSDA